MSQTVTTYLHHIALSEAALEPVSLTDGWRFGDSATGVGSGAEPFYSTSYEISDTGSTAEEDFAELDTAEFTWYNMIHSHIRKEADGAQYFVRTGTFAHSIRYDIGTGDGEQRFNMQSLRNPLWTEYYVRFPTNYTHVGGIRKFHLYLGDAGYSPPQSCIHAWLNLYATSGEGQLAGLEMPLIYYPPNGYVPEPSWDGTVVHYKEYYVNRNLVGPSNGHDDFILDADLGSWIRVRQYAKAATANDAEDGVFKLWKNDDLVIHFDDVPWYDASFNGFQQGWLGGSNEATLSETTYVMWDDVKFYDSDPGW